jgi:hypothetical protein
MQALLNTVSTNYNKFVIYALTAVLVFGNAMAGQDLGLTSHEQNWANVILAAAGAGLGLITANKNQPTLPPNTVVVQATDVQPGAKVLAQHKP